MNQYELEGLWAEGALPNVTYKFGDEVRMKGGERAGEAGRIVALIAIDPAPHYVIEFPDGTSASAVQSEVERAVK
jgi:hypothetical protein